MVLVAPSGPLNIGAVARSMKNYGVRDLRLVAPRCRDHLCADARRMAAHAAADVLASARVFASLAECVADAGYVLATSARDRGGPFDAIEGGAAFTSPAQAFRSLIARRDVAARDDGDDDDDEAAGDGGSDANEHGGDGGGAVRNRERRRRARIALVFGREDSGLNTAEVSHATHLLRIPTAASRRRHDDDSDNDDSGDAYQSLNLSHAATICMYELHQCIAAASADAASTRAQHRAPRASPWSARDRSIPPAPAGEVQQMITHLERVLRACEHIDDERRAPSRMASIRKRVAELLLTSTDVGWIRGMLRDMERSLARRR